MKMATGLGTSQSDGLSLSLAAAPPSPPFSYPTTPVRRLWGKPALCGLHVEMDTLRSSYCIYRQVQEDGPANDGVVRCVASRLGCAGQVRAIEMRGGWWFTGIKHCDWASCQIQGPPPSPKPRIGRGGGCSGVAPANGEWMWRFLHCVLEISCRSLGSVCLCFPFPARSQLLACSPSLSASMW